MVQVDMIGEGTDIKPISVLVKADLVRAVGKTMQQVFRGMRYVPQWPAEANRCDLYAADDSDVAETLRWIAAEEVVGVKKSKATGGGGEGPTAEPTTMSAWEVTTVRQGTSQTLSLDQMPGYRPADQFHRDVPRQQVRPVALDVAARERELRQACAELAKELSYAADVSVRQVHAAWKQQGRGQGPGRRVGRRPRQEAPVARAVAPRRPAGLTPAGGRAPPVGPPSSEPCDPPQRPAMRPHPDLPPGVRRATASGYDAERLGRAMSGAFADDSASAYLWPDPDERRDALRWYYGVLVPRVGFGGGRVYTADGGVGQSVWVRPGHTVGLAAGVKAGALGFPRRFGAAATWRLKTLTDTIDALRRDDAPPDHWYLLLLGVEPRAQGNRWGTRLMAPMFAEADRQRRAVYLETSTPSNVPYYERHGFRVVGERRVPRAHPYWGMARPPA